MANTLKFGGNWAIKEDSILAYSDQYDNYKPLPFDFTRASNATVVNKEGLIETVGNGIPRIDFSDSEDGALLLEPQRTNLVTYSEDFSDADWTKTGATIIPNSTTSPNGTLNADKISEDTSTGEHFIQVDGITTVDDKYSFLLFVKAGESSKLRIRGANYFTNITGADFDLIAKTATNLYEGVNASIVEMSDGWFKCTFTSLNNAFVGGNAHYRIYLLDDLGATSYTGDGTSGLYIYGAQLEQGSYATSYIPTSGSAVTRLAESCSQTTPSGVIGQTEGTMYWEGKFQDTSNPILMQIVPSSTNYLSSIYIDFNKSANLINFYIYDSGLLQATFNTSATTETKYKIALAYKQNDIQAYVNGVSIGSDTTATIQSGLNNLLIGGLVGYINNSSFIGTKPNDVKLYNTRLSNSELAALTQV